MQAIRQITRGPIRAHLKALTKPFSTIPSGGGEDDAAHWGGASASDLNWDDAQSPTAWSTGIAKAHFDGEVVGRKIGPGPDSDPASLADGEVDPVKELQAEHKWSSSFVDTWDQRLRETTLLINQAREPGVRGSYLKDSEKAEMYKKHKENPEVYTVERLAKEYRIMRQRVHAILWLKEDEEKIEKELGRPLDDTVEILIDSLPECFRSHDREFHVANLPRKPNFVVMPEGWDGTTRDPDEVHYEISMEEDEQLYQEFLTRFNFNKMKMDNKVKVHKYSRRRPTEGWNFMVEKLGSRERGKSGGKFISQADGSSRALNDFEMMFVKRETPRKKRETPRKKIVP